MTSTRYVIGIDVSTQTVRAMLAGIVEENGAPAELVIREEWSEARSCRDEASRKNPEIWVGLVRECISGLKNKAPEAEDAEAIGVSTTFPGVFAIISDGSIDPRFVSLYDNTDDSGICGGEFDDLLGDAESETLNRMWPGNMALGLVWMLKAGLELDSISKVVPPNSALALAVLNAAGVDVDPAALFSDLTQTSISGIYDSRSGDRVPPRVAALITRAFPEVDIEHLRTLLPEAAPSWRNSIGAGALAGVRRLLGLPKLLSISIGAGDSPLGMLALAADRDTIVNVRGSSDSPMILVDAPRPRSGDRETVLHYPLPTATSFADRPWCVVAPMLRSGRVWDWVRDLRFSRHQLDADAKLEALAMDAFRASKTSGPPPPVFDTALGGERAPSWDSYATGSISGLLEAHGIGDIALAALVGMSETLHQILSLMERRYEVHPAKLLLAGGPIRNRLWNSITQERTKKRTFATTFSDASLLGAAILGYGTLYDGRKTDQEVSNRLTALSRLSASHPLVAPIPVQPVFQETGNQPTEQPRSAFRQTSS